MEIVGTGYDFESDSTIHLLFQLNSPRTFDLTC
jgi:hypothetical protein